MLLLGILIGLVVGAGVMHLVREKKVSELVGNLSEVQAKLKSTRSQLYRKRATYRKKSNAGSNGKKTTRKKTTQHAKKANVKKAI